MEDIEREFEQMQNQNKKDQVRKQKVIRSVGKTTKNKNKNKTNDLNADLKELKKNTKLVKKAGYTEMLGKILTQLNKYNPDSRFLNLSIAGKKGLQVNIAENKYEGRKYTREQIHKIITDLSKSLKDQGFNGQLSTALYFDDIGWRSSFPSRFGEQIHLYEAHDSDLEFYKENKYFQEFQIYIFETPAPKGKTDDKYNDCLFNCLQSILLEDNPFKKPEKLKQYLGIGRSEGVDLSLIPKLEAKLKIKVNVSGDYIYTSPLTTLKSINLKLINEHYTVDHEISCKAKMVSYKERKILLFDGNEAYDGIKKWIPTREEKREIYSFKTDYIMIMKDSPKKEPIEITFDTTIKMADTLKKETNGKVNMYKTGSVRNTALNLFDKLTKYISIPDDIKQVESIWISKATNGGLIYHKPYSGPAYEYDYVSMYLSIMNGMMLVPLKSGEFQTISTEEYNKLLYPKYGIYRCRINRSEDETINQLFRFNYDDHYTHFSLSHARLLGLKVEMIEDGQANVLHYSRDKCLTSKEIFGKYAEFLFPIKDRGVKEIKGVINILWGALSEINAKTETESEDSEDINIESSTQLINIVPCDSDKTKNKCDIVKDTNVLYKSTFARIAPFITAKGRLMIATVMKPIRQHVQRVHTDGFMTNQNVDTLISNHLGKKLGDVAYKGYCDHITVTSNARPEGEFII